MVQHDSLSALIDHTILRPDATPDTIDQHCRQAVEHGFKAVCVNAIFIPQVVGRLAGSGVLACSVVGFPLGAVPTAIKAAEIELVLSWGAAEIDMVIAIGGLKAGQVRSVTEEVATLKRLCGGACLKAILETSLLTDAEIVAGCHAVRDAGADFVKTSTGFAGQGATVEHVALMRRAVGPGMGVKASGGISTRAAAEAMVAAGANRIGASRSVEIVRESA